MSTVEYIPGTSGFTRTSFVFDPEGLLRPNAPVEIIVHRTGERPYTLRFTTTGASGPSATPLPDRPSFANPGPTPIPTATQPDT